MIGKKLRFEKHLSLWRDCFGDTEQYMKFYFEKKAPASDVFEDWEGNKLCSMAFFTPYDAVFLGEKCVVPYVVGVATRADKRHEGRMTKVLTEGMAHFRGKKSPLVFLSPADPAIYKPLGFRETYWKEVFEYTGAGKLSLTVRRWDELSERKKQEAALFAESRIESLQRDFHLIHHVSYYNQVHEELKALDGALYVFFEGEKIAGVANWICEDGENEVTELICAADKGIVVLESLLAVCEGISLKVEDSTFLPKSELKKRGIAVRREKNPYMMYRMLCETCERPLSAYMNDIT